MYTYITDPGHGWLRVPIAEVQALEIEVSPYSYHDKDRGLVYLEEDLDMMTFINAKMKADNYTGTIKEWGDDNIQSEYVERTHIRNLPCYTEPESYVVNPTLQPKLF